LFADQKDNPLVDLRISVAPMARKTSISTYRPASRVASSEERNFALRPVIKISTSYWKKKS
jgi:hypothetical protein